MKTLKPLAKLAVGLGLMLLVFLVIDLPTLGDILGRIQWPFAVLILALAPVNIVLSALKWKWILDAYGAVTPLRTAIRLYWSGSYMNNFLPSYVGGDAYKLLSLRKSFGGKGSEIASSIVLERALGGISQLLLIIVFGLFSIGQLPNQFVQGAFIGSLVLTVLVVPSVLVLNRMTRTTASGWKPVRNVKHITQLVTGFSNKRILVRALGVSLLFQLIIVLTYWAGFAAFGNSLSLPFLLFTVPLISLVNHIPISFNSLGVREGTAAYVYHLVGISPELTVSVVLLTRVLSLCISAGGAFGFTRQATVQPTESQPKVV